MEKEYIIARGKDADLSSRAKGIWRRIKEYEKYGE